VSEIIQASPVIPNEHHRHRTVSVKIGKVRLISFPPQNCCTLLFSFFGLCHLRERSHGSCVSKLFIRSLTAPSLLLFWSRLGSTKSLGSPRYFILCMYMACPAFIRFASVMQRRTLVYVSVAMQEPCAT
jgi:hypothetical protein